MDYEQLRKPHKTAVHLWEFLLDLLLDGKSDNVICWINREKGEFKLKNQEEVARRWGNLKHRPGMNYDKLSRALRYYYQKGIIKKVSGQRLAYRFVKPLFGQRNGSASQEVSSTKKVPTESKSTTAEEDTKQAEENSKGTGTKEVLVIPTVPCVRTIASEAPETTVSSSPMGFRIIPAPLVNPGHMTYPVYPYLVPYVIPTCRTIGIIKS